MSTNCWLIISTSKFNDGNSLTAYLTRKEQLNYHCPPQCMANI